MDAPAPRQYLVTRSDPRVPLGARLMWVWVESNPPTSLKDDPAGPSVYFPTEIALPAEAVEVELDD